MQPIELLHTSLGKLLAISFLHIASKVYVCPADTMRSQLSKLKMKEIVIPFSLFLAYPCLMMINQVKSILDSYFYTYPILDFVFNCPLSFINTEIACATLISICWNQQGYPSWMTKSCCCLWGILASGPDSYRKLAALLPMCSGILATQSQYSEHLLYFTGGAINRKKGFGYTMMSWVPK